MDRRVTVLNVLGQQELLDVVADLGDDFLGIGGLIVVGTSAPALPSDLCFKLLALGVLGVLAGQGGAQAFLALLAGFLGLLFAP